MGNAPRVRQVRVGEGREPRNVRNQVRLEIGGGLGEPGARAKRAERAERDGGGGDRLKRQKSSHHEHSSATLGLGVAERSLLIGPSAVLLCKMQLRSRATVRPPPDPKSQRS